MYKTPKGIEYTVGTVFNTSEGLNTLQIIEGGKNGFIKYKNINAVGLNSEYSMRKTQIDEYIEKNHWIIQPTMTEYRTQKGIKYDVGSTFKHVDTYGNGNSYLFRIDEVNLLRGRVDYTNVTLDQKFDVTLWKFENMLNSGEWIIQEEEPTFKIGDSFGVTSERPSNRRWKITEIGDDVHYYHVEDDGSKGYTYQQSVKDFIEKLTSNTYYLVPEEKTIYNTDPKSIVFDFNRPLKIRTGDPVAAKWIIEAAETNGMELYAPSYRQSYINESKGLAFNSNGNSDNKITWHDKENSFTDSRAKEITIQDILNSTTMEKELIKIGDAVQIIGNKGSRADYRGQQGIVTRVPTDRSKEYGVRLGDESVSTFFTKDELQVIPQKIEVGDIVSTCVSNIEWKVVSINGDEIIVDKADGSTRNIKGKLSNNKLVRKGPKRPIIGYKLLKDLPGIKAGAVGQDKGSDGSYRFNNVGGPKLRISEIQLADRTWFEPIYQPEEVEVKLSKDRIVTIKDNVLKLKGLGSMLLSDFEQLLTFVAPQEKAFGGYTIKRDTFSIGCQDFVYTDYLVIIKAVKDYKSQQ